MMMNEKQEDKTKKVNLQDLNPFRPGLGRETSPFSDDDLLGLVGGGVGGVAKKAAPKFFSRFFSKKPVTPKATTPKPVTPKATTPKPVTPKATTPKSRGKLAKTLSKFSLPSLPSLKGLSNVTSAVRKATKPEEEKLKNEAYQWLGMTLLEKSAAWTRKAGKNPSGGLNAKGVASYRAKNPGSKLKTAVTTKPSKLKKGSKAAKRRSSFCSRMSGMRKRQNPKNNTGKDRLSLSLKKWNC